MTTAPQRQAYIRPAPGPNPWLIRLPVLLLTGAVLLMAALVVLLALFRMGYTDRITPGVSAMGVDLGGMTRDEAITTLSQRFTYPDEAVFTLSHGETAWDLSAGELGVQMDIEATVDQALELSHSGNIGSDLVDQAQAWFSGYAVAPIIHYDQSVTADHLVNIANAVNQPPQNATLAIENNSVVTTPGAVGRVMDVNATLSNLNNAIVSLSGGAEIPLIINETPPRIWNANEAANQIQAALSGPLELYADSPTGERLGPWSISMDQINALLSIETVDNGDGTARYAVGIDMTVFEDFLSQLAPGLIAAPSNGRFHFDEATGELVMIEPAVNGRELNVQETLARLQSAVFRYEDRSVPMAFDYTLPPYHAGVTAAELGITELVAEATTYFTGSTANRRHNIAEGGSRFDGVIIGPGEEFSFNQWLGDVSLEAGFVESKVIEGERTVDGIGGGICQVSTTAFRAAFFGGYPIIERNSHAYRVGFYELNGPPGLDAAIWTPERDFRFQNDTQYHLLIETSFYPANNTLQFRLYSTNPGRVVEIQEPTINNVVPPLETRYEPNNELQPGQALQVDWAAEGAEVNIDRIIRDMSGNEIRRDNIYTYYYPWGAVYQVAPGDGRLN